MKRSTVLAFLVLALLGGYIYFFERESAVEEEGEPVFALDRSTVARISIRERDGEAVVLDKVDDAWHLVEPLRAPADDEEVTLLLDNLETMRFERAVAKASEVELSSFGLDAPVVSVSFRTEDGDEQTLRFGSDTPTSGNRYALREGSDDIVVLGSYLSLNFEKTAWDLRDKAIFLPREDAPVERIVIERPADELVLVRSLEDDYRIESPFTARADRFEAASLARAIRTAEMQELVGEAESDAASGEFTPTVRVTVTLTEGGPLLLEVGEKKDFDYFARSESREERFLVDGSLVDDLTAPATLYVAKKLFTLSPGDVDAFRINDRVFEKGDDDVWQQTAPERDAANAEAESIQRLLGRLTAMSAEDVVSTRDAGVGFTPASSLSVVSKDEPVSEERIEVGAPREGYVPLRRDGEGVLLRVPEATWAELESLLTRIAEASETP